MNDFVTARKALKRQIVARAKALYPNFDEMWSEETIGYEGGAFCKEDALREAEESLEAGLTVAEWKAKKEANRRVLRTVYFTPEEDEAIRVEAARSGRSRSDVVVELLRIALKNR